MTDLDIFIENSILFRIRINNPKIKKTLLGSTDIPMRYQECILLEQNPQYYINKRKKKFITVDDQYKFLYTETEIPNEVLMTRGLLSYLESKMKEFKITHAKHFTIKDVVDVENAQKIKDMDVWEVLSENFLPDFVEDRYYQTEPLKDFLFRTSGINVTGTGGGKTPFIIYFVRLVQDYLKTANNVLIIVPELTLIRQIPDKFVEFTRDDQKDEISKRLNRLGDSYSFKKLKLNKEKNILVSSYQSLVRRSDEWLQQFDCVIVDEAHKSPCESILKILSRCTNANYRIGLTATMKDGYDGRVISGMFGDILFEKNEGELMEEGFLAPLDITCINWKYVNNLLQLQTIFKADIDNEMAFIRNNYEKLRIYNYIMKNYITSKDNTIILFKNLDVLYFTYMYFRTHFPDKNCVVIHATQNMNQIKKFDDSRKYLKYLNSLDYSEIISTTTCSDILKIFKFTKLKNIGQFDRDKFAELCELCVEKEAPLSKLEPFIEVIEDKLKNLFTKDALKNIFRKKDLVKFLKGKADLYFKNELFDECMTSLNTVHTKNRHSDIDVFRDTVGNFMFAIDTTVNTGLDVDNFHVGILGQNIKAEARLIQGVGRFVRPQEDKLARWIDIVDDLTHIGIQGGFNKNIAYNHSIDRKEHYVKHGYEYSEMSLNIDELEEI